MDTAQHKLVIKLRDGSAKELVLTGNTVIRISGQLSSEAELKPGMEVEIQYLPATNTALRINTSGRVEAEAHGTIQAVDATNHKLVVQLKNGTTLSLTMTADTVLRIQGKQSLETDLKAGMEVEVRYRTDTNTALRINATEKGSASITVSGTLKAVNPLTNTVTITTLSGEDLTLKVTSDTKLLQ